MHKCDKCKQKDNCALVYEGGITYRFCADCILALNELPMGCRVDRFIKMGFVERNILLAKAKRKIGESPWEHLYEKFVDESPEYKNASPIKKQEFILGLGMRRSLQLDQCKSALHPSFPE